MFQHLAAKLPISRWQRDLSDSTAIRGVGTAFGHLVVALSSLERGLGKLEINQARFAAELEDEKAWEVVAEAIQTMMRTLPECAAWRLWYPCGTKGATDRHLARRCSHGPDASGRAHPPSLPRPRSAAQQMRTAAPTASEFANRGHA